MCTQWRLWSAWASAHSNQESSLCAFLVAKDPSFLHAESEDSDQTGQVPMLIWVFAGRTCHSVSFVMWRLVYSRDLWLTFMFLSAVMKPFTFIEPSHEKICLQSLQPGKTNQFAQPQKLVSLQILDTASIGIIRTRQWTTKTLTRLRRCAGWSAPLLFTYGIKQVLLWWGSYLEILTIITIMRARILERCYFITFTSKNCLCTFPETDQS